MVLMEPSCPDEVRMTLSRAETLTVSADSEHLKQILWNLAMNAIEAMPEGGDLEFVIRPGTMPGLEHEGPSEGQSWVEVGVRDSGPGVGDELESRIFEPFFTTKPSGSGLGLATVHQLVEAQGGTVLVENGEGGGAFFCVRLPGIESVS